MRIKVRVTGADGAVKAEAAGEGRATLVHGAAYAPGDVVHLSSDGPGYVVARLEDSIAPVFGLLKGEYALPIPFGEKRAGYSPKSFAGDLHLLWARAAEPFEVAQYRNLALNPLDHHGNGGLFPHAEANVETRGETQFAARNAVDGNVCSAGHGPWPYESWGVGQREDAEIRVEFGRPVRVDRLAVTLRADFPHDNWWKAATIGFSDGSAYELKLVKSGLPQAFSIPPRTVSWLRMGGMVKEETDPSPYPALIQLEAWGHNVQEVGGYDG